ncbi:serine/threonine-protein kinase [Streptomyces leeuwenhoekii]|uniref:non-specific serine/threonine protein kinase n=1 Tax=Streptomyces leeuwenhoekii TaxID=1437453 RepID=A0A0F7VS14_STRLW|nr:serine/threonine-protein kinase [Streptomyces leeuwenhoekii]CQR59651.1 Serine/threonine-protein kinase pknB [Streptomyces leeuwenhoekii]
MRPGDELAGRYVVKEVIGVGRGGEVWLAHDTVVGQDVALKPEWIEGDRETALRLLGEARALAQFRAHPHVVTLFDVVTEAPEQNTATTYWFVMEHVPGGGLDGKPSVPPRQAARIGAQLADALATLHEAGVVHCDVKPANIGLTRHGTAKLLDFGAAYRIGGAETITANGPYSFTPDYAAPELARGNVPLPASDVFCLAATLHALVTGAPPRGEAAQRAGGEDSARLAYWKAEQGVVEIDADAVGPLLPVLSAMLRRDPRDRPEAAEARRLLAAVADGKVRRPRWWLPTAALGASAALVVALFAVSSNRDDRGDDAAGGTGSGSAQRQLPGDSLQGAARSLIGDPHTADVCALADPAAFDRFGESRVDVDYGNFDRCDVLVQTDDENRIDVSFQLRDGSPPELTVPSRAIGAVAVREEPPAEDECALLLSHGKPGEAGDVVRIRVDVDNEGTVTGGAATLCTVAEAAARSAAEVLNRGPLPRRTPTYPAESLAWADACTLLDAKALSAVPGIKADAPKAGVANWSCEWFSDVDDLEARIAFFRDQPKSARDGDPVRLGGNDAVIVPRGDGDGTCTVFVVHREYGGHDAETAAEMLRLHVGGRRPLADLCGMATDLAASAAANLPAL